MGDKVSLSKDEPSALVPTQANCPAVTNNYKVGVVGHTESVKSTLASIFSVCPKCGHKICVCSLRDAVQGDFPEDGF